MLIPNSSPVSPQPAAFAAAEGSRDAAAADDRASPSRSIAASSPASFMTRPRTPSSATSRFEPEPTTSTADAAPAAQAQQLDQLVLGRRAGEELRRAAGAHRRQPGERVVALDPGGDVSSPGTPGASRRGGRLVHKRLGEPEDVAGADRHQQVALAEPRRRAPARRVSASAQPRAPAARRRGRRPRGRRRAR